MCLSKKLSLQFYPHLLNPQDVTTCQEFYKLNLDLISINTDNTFGGRETRAKYLSIQSLETSEFLCSMLLLKALLKESPIKKCPPSITKLLIKLKNDQFTNLNCQNLIQNISIEDKIFTEFIQNCLFTIYMNQLTRAKHEQQEKIKTKILFSQFIF